MSCSRGEIKIKEILEMNGLNFQQEYSFPDLISSSRRALRFDFAVFDDNGDIDFKHFGGKRNLARQQYNDNQKRIYCARKEIPLVIIPYWKFIELDYDLIINCAYNGGGVV